MVDGGAKSVQAASADARLSASLVVTRLVARAILVDDTLRVDTDSSSVDDATLSVGPARRGIARVRWNGFLGRFPAEAERISDQGRRAAADRAVVDHVTHGRKAADSGARVDTLGVGACFVTGTVRADGTFRTTVSRGWRPEEPWQALADRVLVDHLAQTIQAAR